ncbi:MAG: SDR family oxidoreductase [Gammaproteobacteria bacterium]|jgi:NAD(P)-dependent dehydrogenase (short-subunit alcohol dehydrogenase family)|nr:SDR family oxidoreductase [Gammaproteobacteria bacterium]
MIDLSQKIAVVSGGATLIGEKIAEAFVNSGAKVIVADINDEDGNKLADKLGDNVHFIKTDITSDENIDSCISESIAHFGGIDFLINVACTYLDNGADSSRDEWLTALNTNVIGAAIFTQKVTPQMKKRGGGAVVNFGSISGKRAQPGRMLYATSKAAILGMTRNQALLLAEDNIRINSVSPGWTWSNVIRDFSGNNREKADGVAEPFHLNSRLVDAEEVASSVVFLCSDAASGINGTDLAVDGGYTAIGPEQKTDRLPELAS